MEERRRGGRKSVDEGIVINGAGLLSIVVGGPGAINSR